MDLKDLMVGDWVNVNGLNLKVGAIHADEIGVIDPDYKIYWCSDDEFDRIDPIPLTEEILVKNGWRKHIMLYKNEWYGDIGLFEEHGKFYYMDLKIEYVHQLQHLLRLCGVEKELTI